MYDTSGCVDPEPRVPGFHDAHCRVTWTPHPSDGRPGRTVVGAYLDADSAAGRVYLGCGIESAVHDLGVGHLVDHEHMAPLAEAVSAQLRDAPAAEIRCRAGMARVELTPFPGRAAH